MIGFVGTRIVLEDFKKRTSIKVILIPSNSLQIKSQAEINEL